MQSHHTAQCKAITQHNAESSHSTMQSHHTAQCTVITQHDAKLSHSTMHCAGCTLMSRSYMSTPVCATNRQKTCSTAKSSSALQGTVQTHHTAQCVMNLKLTRCVSECYQVPVRQLAMRLLYLAVWELDGQGDGTALIWRVSQAVPGSPSASSSAGLAPVSQGAHLHGVESMATIGNWHSTTYYSMAFEMWPPLETGTALHSMA